MAKPASQKNRNKKRKQKQKTYRQQSSHQAKKEKGGFYFEGALYYIDLGNYEKTVSTRISESVSPGEISLE